MPGDGTGGGAGSGTATQTGTGGDQQQRRGPRIKPRRQRDYSEESSDYTDRLIRKYGSKDKALEVLGGELFDLREERREQDAEIETMKAKLTPDGAVVLTGAKAEAWKKIDALATELKLPEDKLGEKIVERVKKADTLEAKEAKDTKSKARKDVAAAADMDGDVLDPLLEQFGLEVETKEIQVQGTDGKLTPKKVAHVRKAGDANAAWEKLSDFAARDGSPLKPFAVALAKKTSTTTQTTNAGFNFPDQQGGTSNTAGSAVDKKLEQINSRANRANPLVPQRAEEKKAS